MDRKSTLTDEMRVSRRKLVHRANRDRELNVAGKAKYRKTK